MSTVVLQTLAKPAGLSVLPPHHDVDGDCLLRRLLAEEPWRATLPWPPGFEGGLAHRLDGSTSGAVAVAADPDQLGWIRGLFTAKHLQKTYLLWSSRPVPWDEHSVDRPLAHDRRHKGRMVVQRGARTPHRGRWLPAQTRFARIEGGLWRAEMRTGVMHQIRLHAAFAGIPIRGDRRYGGGPVPPDAGPGVSFFLHHVGFTGPGVRTTDVPAPPWTAGARQGPGESR